MDRVLFLWTFACICGLAVSVLYNEDEWEPVFRIYKGDDWNSYNDYVSQERTAKDGNEDDSQFRSWKLDKWIHLKIQKVRVEVYDEGDLVAEFEFDGNLRNATNFFSARSLKRSTFTDLPDGPGAGTSVFSGDGFSFEGDGSHRHWTISSRHVSNCRTDDGWFQIVDRPTPGQDICMCGYENMGKYPAIMYSKSKRKTKWADARTVGYADMMQISVSTIPYPTPAPIPVTPDPMQNFQHFQQQFMMQQQQQQHQPPQIAQTNMWLELRKRK